MSTITRRAALAAAATLAAPSILRAQAAPLKIGLVTFKNCFAQVSLIHLRTIA
jgi:hypothetical protein